MIPQTNREHLVGSLLSGQSINIFDVFAILYAYCKPRFNQIFWDLGEHQTCEIMYRSSAKIVDTILPRLELALAPIDTSVIVQLISEIDSAGNERLFDQRCYTVIHAIDIAYESMAARSINVSNFAKLSQRLNLIEDFGRVYPKRPSPMLGPAEGRIRPLRTGGKVATRLRDYLQNLTCVNVPAGYDLDFGVLNSTLRMTFPADLHQCKILSVPLVDQIAHFDIETFSLNSQGERPFRFRQLLRSERIAELAISALRSASEKGATVVIFPELCVPDVIRSAIREGLRTNAFPNIKIVVAGSFHEQVGEYWYNICHVLGPDGQDLWQQRKFEPFVLMRYEAQRMPSFAYLSDCDSREHIYTSPRVVTVRDTPLGRMAILICSDFLRSDPCREILFDLRVDIVLVPSLSPVLDPDFISPAKDFAVNSETITIVCNACAFAREARQDVGGSFDLGFVFIPQYPPIRWFRCDALPGDCITRNCHNKFVFHISSWPVGFDKL